MGWFDEQIKQRRQNDDNVFASAFAGIADAVLGKRVSSAFETDRDRTKSEIDSIFRYYHIKPSEFSESITDINEQLEYMTRPRGIMRRSVKLAKGWRRDATGAMLGFKRSDGAPVALIPTGLAGYSYFDYERGKTVKVGRKSEALFEDEAIVFYKPFPQTKLSLAALGRYIIGVLSLSDLFLLGGAMLAIALLGLLTTKLNHLLIGAAVQSGSLSLLLAIMTFMASATLASLLINAVRGLMIAKLQTKLNLTVQAATMARIMLLPPSFFKKRSAGELASMAGQINSLCMMIISSVLSGGLTSIFSIMYISQIFAYAPSLAAVALLVLLATALFSVVVSIRQVGISRKEMKLEAKESGMSYAMIAGIQKIKLAGAEKRAFARFGKVYTQRSWLVYNPPALIKYKAAISLLISSAGMVALFYMATTSRVPVADYFAFNTAYGMVSGAFMSLVSVAMTAAGIGPILDIVKPILDAVPEVADGKQVITRLSGGIELNNVSFRYSDTMPNVIDNLSLKIRPGQRVAIVGATGCGKSTLMRLMLGLETPQKGAVYYDGKDLSTVDLKSIRRRVGSVMQNGKLFSGDIFSNITVSAPWMTMDDAWEAAETAEIAEDIRRMPMGMHTLISEGTGGISGGQKQRLMLARAIAPKPRILMLDEATSALDNITQKKVSAALDKMKCTRIVIAHRLSTIKQYDRIIYLENGRIAEDGTYDELIAANGRFAELVARQRIGE